MGRAIGDANRPGSFPCPDGDDDGSADLFAGSGAPGVSGGCRGGPSAPATCATKAANALVRADTRFRDHPPPRAQQRHPRRADGLQRERRDRASRRRGHRSRVRAGAALAGQARGHERPQCSDHNKERQRRRCRRTISTRREFSNASAAGPYIAAPDDSYNDRVAVIVTADIMPLVERRVARGARNALSLTRPLPRAACYPWADNGTDGISESGREPRPHPRIDALPHAWPTGIRRLFRARTNGSG